MQGFVRFSSPERLKAFLASSLGESLAGSARLKESRSMLLATFEGVSRSEFEALARLAEELHGEVIPSSNYSPLK